MSAKNVTGGRQFMVQMDMTTGKDSLQSAQTAQNQCVNIGQITLRNEERQKCEVWSRVMGYHRPVTGWNIGKKQEFEDRKPFKEVV